MKDLLLLQARYNKLSDKNMFDVFFSLEKEGKKELLYKDCGLFYTSIINTDVHNLYGSTRLFLGQIANFADKKPSNLSALLAHLRPDFSLLDSLTQDLGALFELHEQVNDTMIDIIANMSDFSKNETLNIAPNFSFTKPRFQLILTLLNHTTHHRGQIAGALDIMQVPNDFASTMFGI